jgi:nitrite reductase/ring-hydroxylating ferredoxin subunit/uncharacterized membrane protein
MEVSRIGPLTTAVSERIDSFDGLDALARSLQKKVSQLVPQGSPPGQLLSGTWLGHPLHPVLTDAVIGCWTGAGALDLLGGDRTASAADRLVGLGILAALPTAAAGLTDWSDLMGPARRYGAVHAAANTAALGLYSLSWLARKDGRRGTGVALGLLGAGVASAAAWIGGHLVYGKGIGVSQTAFTQAPKTWSAVGDADGVKDGVLTGVESDGVGILLVKRGRTVDAILDRCTHRGCDLHTGTLNDDETVTCPCHGSTFRLDGSIVRGPATAPQGRLEARIREGKIEVRAAR